MSTISRREMALTSIAPVGVVRLAKDMTGGLDVNAKCPAIPRIAVYVDAYQETAEPATPTSVASSTRYRDLRTWTTPTNEHECPTIRPLQTFEQELDDSEIQKHEWDVDELAMGVQGQTQHGLCDEQSLEGRRTAHHGGLRYSRRRPRRSARIRQRKFRDGMHYGQLLENPFPYLELMDVDIVDVATAKASGDRIQLREERIASSGRFHYCQLESHEEIGNLLLCQEGALWSNSEEESLELSAINDMRGQVIPTLLESMNDMSSEQVVPNKLSDPSECMRAYQEPAEPDTPDFCRQLNANGYRVSSSTFSTKNLIRIWKGAKLHIIVKRKAAATDLDGPHASVNENSKLGNTMAYDDQNE
ncbi:hypothetical protein PG993_008658 [Apiospora rasikravindrae]|uniref:Uncharacterized protein n=1 Tax=Apiospora rasikravindrae TaxID=990691 RepID=A0ABR1SQS0_9PEZI